MPARAKAPSLLEHQLLLQLGDRLRLARKAQKWTSVAFARHVGLSRTTLYSIEGGDPSVTLGAYLRVLSTLGMAGDLAMLGTTGVPPRL